MGGCRCSYKNCTNTTKSPDNIHFFHFPVKYRDRCIQWIETACKPNFYNLEEDQLRNKVICEMHFDPKWFPNNQKKRLLQGAIPTLDGDCNNDGPASPMESEAPVYLPSNQYNDVKVVPANEDGTVFVLDTENMFTISPKIESYIIKNGVLVPTNSSNTPRSLPNKFVKQMTSNRFIKPSTSTAGYLAGTETEIANINTPPGPSKSSGKEQMYHCPSFIKREVPEVLEAYRNKSKTTDNGEFLTFDAGASQNIIQEPEDKKPNPAAMVRQGSNQHSNNHGPSKTVVSKSYLRQIKQHSRDIASIKRMLRQKRVLQQAKPDLKTILNELQQQIPSSLFTIISLLLGEKNELNEDDIEFFTTLHRGSPEVYQMLSDKYKWNLPSVDVVDSPPE